MPKNKSQSSNKSQKLQKKVIELESRILQILKSKPAKKKKTKKPKQPRMTFTSAGVHPVAQKLLVGLTAPFAAEASGVKVIGEGAVPSQTWSHSQTYSYQAFSGANGYNIHFLNPLQREAAVFQTIQILNTSGYGSKYYETTSNANANHDMVDMPRPYSNEALRSAEANARIVSMGVKVNFTGQVGQRSGHVIFFDDVSADGSNIFNNINEAGVYNPVTPVAGTLTMNDLRTRIMSHPQARFCSFNEQTSFEFTVHPLPKYADYAARGNDKIFTTTNWSALDLPDIGSWSGYFAAPFGSTPDSTGTSPDNYGYVNDIAIPRTVMIVEGSGVTIQYTIEIVLHMEYFGGHLSAFHTPSPTHIEDNMIVRNAIMRSKETHKRSPATHPFAHVMNELKTHVAAKKAAKVSLEGAIKAAGPTAKDTLLKSMAGLLV